MKRSVLFAITMMAAGSLLAQDAKETLTGAAQKLAAADNYSWKQTTENPGAAGGGGGGGGRGFGFGGGPVDAQTEKDGLIYTKSTFPGRNGGDPTTIETVVKGTKSASKRGDAGWMTPEEAAAARGGGGGGGGGGRGRGFGGFGGMVKTPSALALEIIPNLKNITGDAASGYSGELSEADAKARLNPFGAARGGAAGGGGGGGFQIEVTGAKGTAKFWVKDGVLSKLAVNVQGSVAFGDNDPMDRNTTTTYDIKDVGTTKINVPDDAKKKVM